MTRSPADMYYLALASGYNIYYATEVFFARTEHLGLWKYRPTPKPSLLAIELRSVYETLSK